MDKLSVIQCPKGGSAIKCCILDTCTQSSFMCDNSQCDCHKNHNDCDFMIPLSNILERIGKVKSRFTKSLNEIKEWYQHTTKILQVQKENLIQVINSKVLLSQGSVNEFNNLLKQGRSNEITSQLVMKSLNSLSKEYNISQQKQYNEIKIHIDIKNKEIQKLLLEVKEKWICKIRAPFQKIHWSQKFNDSHINIDGNKIKCKQNVNSNVMYGFANGNIPRYYLQPTIENSFSFLRKFQFKINTLSSSSNKTIGFCHKIKSKDSIFQNDQIYQISSQISNNQKNKRNLNQNQQFFSQGDTIQISFDPIERIATFLNKTTNESESIVIKNIETKQLFIFVTLSAKGDEIQFLGQTTN